MHQPYPTYAMTYGVVSVPLLSVSVTTKLPRPAIDCLAALMLIFMCRSAIEIYDVDHKGRSIAWILRQAVLLTGPSTVSKNIGEEEGRLLMKNPIAWSGSFCRILHVLFWTLPNLSQAAAIYWHCASKLCRTYIQFRSWLHRIASGTALTEKPPNMGPACDRLFRLNCRCRSEAWQLLSKNQPGKWRAMQKWLARQSFL